MSKTRSIRLTPIADISLYLRKFRLATFNVGYDGLLYFVFDTRPLDLIAKVENFEIPSSELQTFQIVIFDEDRLVGEVLIKDVPFQPYHIAPLPEGLLLANSRSWYRNDDDIEKNGRIYSFDGQFQYELLLGDGIEDLQTTSDGTIWTSYFDEGIFGNFGVSGLVAWRPDGEKIYEFEPKSGLDSMCDCYALNVVSNNTVWCYYYAQFPLVQIKDKRVVAYWDMPIQGATAFAVGGGYALFRGDYETRERYTLFQLQKDRCVELGGFELYNHDTQPLLASEAIGWRDALYLRHDHLIYRFGISPALEQT